MTDDARIQKRMVEVIGQARREIEEYEAEKRERNVIEDRRRRRVDLGNAKMRLDGATNHVLNLARELVGSIENELKYTAEWEKLRDLVAEDAKAEEEELAGIPVNEHLRDPTGGAE